MTFLNIPASNGWGDYLLSYVQMAGFMAANLKATMLDQTKRVSCNFCPTLFFGATMQEIHHYFNNVSGIYR